jgi:hypothetical protein
MYKVTKKLLSVALMFWVLSMSTISGLTLAGSKPHAPRPRFEDRFIGAWRLAWLEEPDAEGIHKVDCTGMLVYTPDGHMSVQVMYQNPQRETQAGPMQYAQGGYEASFGSYEVDERTPSFIFHVEAAFIRSLIGKDLPRAYRGRAGPLSSDHRTQDRLAARNRNPVRDL